MRPPIRDELLIGVLQQYPLANLRVLSPIEASMMNDSFLVEDATGNRYLLRRYRRNPERARVLFQLRFQQELHRRGFPTSEVIESASGSLFVTNEAGSWVLFTYVEGNEYEFARTGQVAEAGRRLGEFHTVSASIQLKEVDLEANPHFRRWWTHGDEELAALSEVFRGDGVEAEIAFLRGWRTELLREWSLARLDALPTGWVHSDYHGRNMVFVGDELCGLFDFDPLHRGYWIEDVAHALFLFSREFRGSTHMRPETARLFVDEYHRARPLEGEERAALPMMAALVWVPSAPYHELLRRDGLDTLAFFRHYVSLMRDLQVEMERLAPVLAEG